MEFKVNPIPDSSHPHWFQADSHETKVVSLFHAIRSLDNGHFKDLVRQLTDMFVEQFEDVPCDKNGNKKIGGITYYKCGLAKNQESYTIIVPPLDTEIGTNDADDMKARFSIIHNAMGSNHAANRIKEQELRYFMTEKVPVIRNGIVGKSLLRITKLVKAVENAGTDNQLALGQFYKKIYAEIDGTLDVHAHERNYPCYSYRFYNGKTYRTRYDRHVLGISYYETESMKDAAEQLTKGALDVERARNILKAISTPDIRKEIFFPSIVAILDTFQWDDQYVTTKAYKNKIVSFLEQQGIELVHDARRTITTDKYTYECTMNTQTSAENYAHDLLSGKTDAIYAVFDAIQAYDMYDGITDEYAREFFTKAGYLVKDWKPEPDLWYRVAKIIPVAYAERLDLKKYKQELLMPDEVHEGAMAIAEKEIGPTIDGFYKMMCSDEMQKRYKVRD